MSNEWIYFPCSMGEQQASILFDYGVRDKIDEIAPPLLLRVEITFREPRDDGLYFADEFPALTALEQELQQLFERHGALYVGRVSVGGRRHLSVYTADDELAWADRLQAVGDALGYPLRLCVEEDPERKGYWEELFPTADDWRVIKDLGVIEAAERHNDELSLSRPIDHWAYFSSSDAAEQFAAWANERRYEDCRIKPTDDGRYCVRYVHHGTLRIADISSHTISAQRKATELGGEYDGWETPVCKAAK